MTAPIPAQPAPPTPAKERRYPTREAECAGCGVTFASTLYGSSGWTAYHSRECSYAHKRKRAAAEDTPESGLTESPPSELVARLPGLASQAREAREATEATEDAPFNTFNSGSIGSIVPVAPIMPVYEPRRQLRQSLHILVDALPEADTWTQAERSRWLEAVWGVLGYALTVSDERTDGPRFDLDWRVGQ